MTFKPGDLVYQKGDKTKILTIKNVPSQSEYTKEYSYHKSTCDFTDGEWDFMYNYELIPENEKPIKDELQENLDKAIEIRQLKQELDIVYQALSYCLYDSDCLSHSHFDWKIETIKKMVELRNLKK